MQQILTTWIMEVTTRIKETKKETVSNFAEILIKILYNLFVEDLKAGRRKEPLNFLRIHVF